MNFHNIPDNTNSDSSSQREQRRARRQLWRDMQDAYRVYVTTSESLRGLDSRLRCISDSDGTPTAEGLEVEHRTAFENYIEARLRYSEFERDEDFVFGSGLQSAVREKPICRRDEHRSLERQLLIAANIVLLAITIGGSVYWAREDRRVQDSAYTRDQKGASLAQNEGDLHALNIKGDSSPPAAPSRLGRNNPSFTMPSRPVTVKKNDRPARGNSKLRSANDRGYYRFRLLRSPELQQAGPVRLSMLKVDPNRRYFIIAVLAGQRTQEKIVRLNVPLWIEGAGGVHLKLMATNIGSKYVDGYFIQSITKNVAATANQARSVGRSRT